jgi:hypothetical protein
MKSNSSNKIVWCSECSRDMSVSYSATGGICSHCTQKRCLSLLTPAEIDKLFGVSSTTSVKPRGWKWMKEFVDSTGNVWHKGVEQPELKGERPVTDVEAIYAKRKVKKEAKFEKAEKALLVHASKVKEAKSVARALEKQKDFLNHNIDKG